MPAPDLILAGAEVRTLDPARPYATAVAVHDGMIAAVGDVGDVRDWRGPGTEVVPLEGAHLVPGLVDAHSHPVWGLDMATGVDLSGVGDLAGLRATLARAERIDGWVIGFGLDHNAFGGRPVDRALVEDALGGSSGAGRCRRPGRAGAWSPRARPPVPEPGNELVPPTQATVNFAFTPIELNHPDLFGVTVVLMEMEKAGYSVR